jgi:protection-of-telomeres protein 1
MSPPLPPSFVTVQDAKESPKGSYVSVIGNVVDVLSPRQSRGSSFVSTFTIKDSELDGESWRGFKMKFFSDYEVSLPSPKLGDVVMVRKIQASQGYGTLGYENG